MNSSPAYWAKAVTTIRRTQPRDREPVVDVVIPVYGNLDVSLEAIRSVLTASATTSYELVVVDDGTPVSRPGSETLQWLADQGLITLLRLSRNLGFPNACNAAFELHLDRDVVLLNSDAEVYGDWLDRLREAAHRVPRIATVTPLSSDGTIVSYPCFNAPAPAPLEISFEELDALTAAVNKGVSVEVPTGIGFCMYFRRQFLSEVGYFDAEAFGRGYGEENDLCQRAIEHGWTNIVAADVFVRHEGGKTFGAVKQSRIDEAVRMVEARHPGYLASVTQLLREDPLAPARRNLDLARIERPTDKRTFLMISHLWGGGTERHLRQLTSQLEASGTPVFTARPDPHERTLLRLQGPVTGPTPNLPVLDLKRPSAEWVRVITGLGIQHAHIHNLAGYPPEAAELLAGNLADAGIPYDVTVHDYLSFCPRINLVGITNVYCGEPGADSCIRCLRQSPDHDMIDLIAWRKGHERLLKGARLVFCPSKDSAHRMNRRFPWLRPVVRPHFDDVHADRVVRPPRRAPGEPGRVGVLGAIGVAKGFEVLGDVAQASSDSDLGLQFVVLGFTQDDQSLAHLDNVEITGGYEDEDLPSLIAEADLDLIWFPAVWPETYSYTLSAALRTALPIVAFDFGAIAERLRDADRGALVDLGLMAEPGRMADLLNQQCRRGSGADVQPTDPHPFPSELLRDYYLIPD